MTILICYGVATAVVVFIWFLFVGLDDLKLHSWRTTAATASIVALIWPVLAVMVVACLALSAWNATPHRR